MLDTQLDAAIGLITWPKVKAFSKSSQNSTNSKKQGIHFLLKERRAIDPSTDLKLGHAIGIGGSGRRKGRQACMQHHLWQDRGTMLEPAR